jgi:hypothetical protein
LNVQVPENWWEKQNRSYLVWQFGKAPEVVIEIVSNMVGGELGNKLKIYSEHCPETVRESSEHHLSDSVVILGHMLRYFVTRTRRGKKCGKKDKRSLDI